MVERPQVNLVMGVASGMPADADLLELALKYRPAGAPWQVTAIGRAEVWALQARAAELGGHLRTGLEDTFYLPDGARAPGNGALVAAHWRGSRGRRGARWPRPPRRARSGARGPT
jgi:3-keto-5-aminohexanoate cleavage enzyme